MSTVERVSKRRPLGAPHEKPQFPEGVRRLHLEETPTDQLGVEVSGDRVRKGGACRLSWIRRSRKAGVSEPPSASSRRAHGGDRAVLESNLLIFVKD